MTRDKLIVKLSLENERLKEELKKQQVILDDIDAMLNSVGQVYNGNYLKFNLEQLKWFHQLQSIIKSKI